MFLCKGFSSDGSFSAWRGRLLLYAYGTVCMDLPQAELQSDSTTRRAASAPEIRK